MTRTLLARRLVILLSGLLGACGAHPAGSTGGGNHRDIAGAAAVSGAGTAAGSGDFGNSDASIPPPRDASIAQGPAPDGSLVRDEACGKVTAIYRDFSPTTHLDFEIPFSITDLNILLGQGHQGIVKPLLEMGYPAYALPGASADTHSAALFYQWYVDTPGVNMHFELPLLLTEDTPGHFIYDSTEFFPLDNMGFGNEGNPHNYHFTTELRTKFTYKGGEIFTFRGDDDVWIFVNGVLAVDLGGLHGPLAGTVNMDTFAAQNALQLGQTYSMDVFQAERHTTGSNFHIETTIECFTVVKPPPPPPPPPPPS